MGAAPQDFRMSSAGGEPVAPLVERGHEVWTLAMRPIATFFGARAFGWEPMSAERAPMKRSGSVPVREPAAFFAAPPAKPPSARNLCPPRNLYLAIRLLFPAGPLSASRRRSLRRRVELGARPL